MASIYERYRDSLRAGHVAAAADHHAAAIVAYRRAAELAPDRAAPWVGIGQTELARRDPRAAGHAFEAALAREPEHALARAGLANVASLERRATGRRPIRPGERDERLDPLVATWLAALDAADAPALAAVADALAARGLHDAAAVARLDAIEVAPDAVEVHLADARARSRRGSAASTTATVGLVRRWLALTDDAADAEDALQTAQDRADVPAILAVAVRHRRAGRPRLALDAATSALRLDPTSIDVHLEIVRIHLAAQRRRTAFTVLERLERLTEVSADDDGHARVLATRQLAATLPPAEPLLL